MFNKILSFDLQPFAISHSYKIYDLFMCLSVKSDGVVLLYRWCYNIIWPSLVTSSVDSTIDTWWHTNYHVWSTGLFLFSGIVCAKVQGVFVVKTVTKIER